MDSSDKERKTKCWKLAGAIMDAMRAWIETEGIKYSPNSQIGKAIICLYPWDNMMKCLEYGRLLGDNNLAENVIRPITLGRLCGVQYKDGKITSSVVTMGR